MTRKLTIRDVNVEWDEKVPEVVVLKFDRQADARLFVQALRDFTCTVSFPKMPFDRHR